MLQHTTRAADPGWSAVRSALVADVLRGSDVFCRSSRPRVRGQIRGESMLPTLWPGDMVEIESCAPEDVRPGEIVLARRDDRLVLHRLVAPCTSEGFLLCGDSVPAPDPQYPPEALLGRLVRRTGKVGGLMPSALSRVIAKFFRDCGVLRRLALRLHRRSSTSTSESGLMESL
jgi:hypothetical protein